MITWAGPMIRVYLVVPEILILTLITRYASTHVNGRFTLLARPLTWVPCAPIPIAQSFINSLILKILKQLSLKQRTVSRSPQDLALGARGPLLTRL